MSTGPVTARSRPVVYVPHVHVLLRRPIALAKQWARPISVPFSLSVPLARANGSSRVSLPVSLPLPLPLSIAIAFALALVAHLAIPLVDLHAHGRHGLLSPCGALPRPCSNCCCSSPILPSASSPNAREATSAAWRVPGTIRLLLCLALLEGRVRVRIRIRVGLVEHAVRVAHERAKVVGRRWHDGWDGRSGPVCRAQALDLAPQVGNLVFVAACATPTTRRVREMSVTITHQMRTVSRRETHASFARECSRSRAASSWRSSPTSCRCWSAAGRGHMAQG